MRRIHRTAAAALPAALGIACAPVAPVLAAQLNPYTPPLQPPPYTSTVPAQPATAPQQAPAIQQPVPDAREAFYKRFDRDVRELKPEQRKALAADLTAKFVDAQKTGRLDAASHYSRLLHILYSYPVTTK